MEGLARLFAGEREALNDVLPQLRHWAAYFGRWLAPEEVNDVACDVVAKCLIVMHGRGFPCPSEAALGGYLRMMVKNAVFAAGRKRKRQRLNHDPELLE